MNRLLLLTEILFAFSIESASSQAQPSSTWTGQSTGNVGAVEYKERCGYECADSYYIEISCDRITGAAHLTIGADSSYEPNSKVRVVFDIDGIRFNLEGVTDEGGLFGPIPTVPLGLTAPLVAALSTGKEFKVFFGTDEPVFEGHLFGSRDAIREACGT